MAPIVTLPRMRLSVPKDHADSTNQLNRIFGQLEGYLHAIPASAIVTEAGTSPFQEPPFPTTAAGSTALTNVGAGTGVSVSGGGVGGVIVSNTGILTVSGQGISTLAGAATVNQQAQRVTTGSIALSTTTPVTLTWTIPFADALYSPQVSIVDSTGFLRIAQIVSFSASTVVVNVQNTDAGSAHTGTLVVSALHD